MIFGYDISRTWVSNLVRSDFGYHHLGRPQAQKGVRKCRPEALACTVLMPRPWIFGNLFNIPTLWINIFGIFWYHPQGQLQAQGGVGKWRPEALVSTVLKLFTWFLGILFNMLSLWKDIIGIFCYHPQGQPQAQEGVGKWSPGTLASTVLKLLTWTLGILVNTQTLRKCIIGIFWYRPQGLTFRLKGVFENWVLMPWYPQFWSF